VVVRRVGPWDVRGAAVFVTAADLPEAYGKAFALAARKPSSHLCAGHVPDGRAIRT